MYNRTLKSFYHGNLTPIDQQMVHGSDVARAVAELSEAEDRLAQVLPPLWSALRKHRGRWTSSWPRQAILMGSKPAHVSCWKFWMTPMKT